MARIAHASAGPSPGGAEKPEKRQEAAAVLAGILDDPKMPAVVKGEAIELLGSVGEAESVPAVARALADPRLADPARKALERIPGEAASRALEAALSSRSTAGASGEARPALIASLARKGSRGPVPALIAIASAEQDPARMAAASALARLGDPSAIPAIRAALDAAKGRDRRALAGEFLRMADGLAAADGEKAREIYRHLLVSSPDESLRCAALSSLAGGAGASDAGLLLDAAGDPSARVRDEALAALKGIAAEGIDKGLRERFERAGGERKAAFLRCLAARKSPGLEAVLAAAAAADDVETRLAALEVQGKLADPGHESFLVTAMEKGSPAARRAACTAYLELADRKAEADVKEACKMYGRVLDYSREPAAERRALRGLGRSGDVAHLPRLEAARKVDALSESANQAVLEVAKAMAKGGKKDEAVSLLLSVAHSGAARETVRSAVAELKVLGADPTMLQKKLGLVASWWVVGPFPNEGGEGFDRPYSPEEKVDLQAQKDHRGRMRRWEEHHSTNPEGAVELHGIFQRRNDVCAYAYTEIVAPEARDVKLKMGSDDGIVCWLNGKKVHAKNETRGLRIDEDSVDARLEKGSNKILLKVTQGGGEWQFSFRVTDRESKPIDLTAWK
jgi:HEAT repeat protein